MEQSNNFFLSRKWKAALFVGLLLLIFSICLSTFTFFSAIADLENRRPYVQQQFIQSLDAELANRSQKLQQLTEHLLLSDPALSIKKYFAATTQQLNATKMTLEQDWQISSAQYFDGKSNKLAGWGEDLPTQIKQHFSTVFQKKSPQTYIDCSQTCAQFNLTPVRIRNRVNAMLVISSPLNIAITDFHQKTGGDIIVLNKSGQNQNLEQFIPQWKMKIESFSSFNNNREHLDNLAKRYSFEDIKLDQTIRDEITPIQLIQKTISPIEFHLIHSKQNHDLLFIVIDDLSEQYQFTLDTTIRSLTFSLIATAFVFLGLFLYLSSSLSRVSLISKVIPLISEQRYEESTALLLNNKKPFFKDEISQLEYSTSQLAVQQEQLYEKIKTHTSSLNNRTEELQQERDFNHRLINTANMVIITLDSQYSITSFNRFAEHVTGYTSEEAVHSSFERFIHAEHWQETKNVLLHLESSSITLNTQHESELIHRHDASIHTLSWVFSSLNHPTDGSVILAVGLDITEKKRNDEHVIWLAEHDVLTELYNRRKFNLTFEQLLDNAKRVEQQGALLFLDLDDFKGINDQYGHKAGDFVLQQVAKTLLSVSRVTDSIFRLGGDEFAVLLPQTNEVGAINFSQKILDQFKQLNNSLDRPKYNISTSVGIVLFPLSNQTTDELVSSADLAMYQAKKKGKNTWHLFEADGEPHTQAESKPLTRVGSKAYAQSDIKTYWEEKIKYALKNNHFILHYQPIMNIQTEEVNHYEVLVRMQDEDNLHFPSAFINAAKQTGLIHHINHFVIKNSIQMQGKLDEDNANISLSINLSIDTIHDSILIPLLKRLMNENHTHVDNIIFELSESAVTPNVDQARGFIELLNSLGYRFSLDNFGHETSSLRDLSELPVDLVKIDGTLIVDLLENEDNKRFVTTLVDIAKVLDKKTIAEFVQNAETLALLKELGVDYAQGYYIGKPKPYFLDYPEEEIKNKLSSL